MRTLTITALMATFVALPWYLHKRRTRLQVVRAESGVNPAEDPRRYDLFDFMS